MTPTNIAFLAGLILGVAIVIVIFAITEMREK